MADSPGSPLSEHGSDEFEEDVKLEQTSDMDDDAIEADHLPSMRPTKKQKVGHRFKATPEPSGAMVDDDGDISSDTSGEAPSSPGGAPTQTAGDDDADAQVTFCKWRGCTVGDLGNMDNLVDHIHQVHVLHRQKKYACEWEGCGRIDATHASGYALRAHMRSHTREKPFYCALPECDKAFTRSDALAKHMRTVHETESLRPSDPVPRNHSYNTNPLKQKLKLVVKPQVADTDGPVSPNDPMDVSGAAFPADFDLTPQEAAMSVDQLYRLWRRKVHWAEEEEARLKKECEELEKARREEWQEKELLLSNVIEADLANAIVDVTNQATPSFDKVLTIKNDMLPLDMLPIHGEPVPFYRQVDTMSVGSFDNIEAANGLNGHDTTHGHETH